MIARAPLELEWEPNGKRPTLLSGACRAWPTMGLALDEWRRLLFGRRARLESPGRVGGIVDFTTALSVLEESPEVPWTVRDRIDERFAGRVIGGVLPAIDFLSEIEPEIAPRLRWIEAAGAKTTEEPRVSASAHVWVALLRGEKRWTLWPPSKTAPRWSTPLVIEQHAGDIVVVPAGVWFGYERMTATIAYVRHTIDSECCAAAITACIQGGALDLADRLVRVAREASWRAVTDPEKTPASYVRPRLR